MPRRGGKRRKTRTHVNPDDGVNNQKKGQSVKLPRSFVVRRGKLGASVDALVDDLRNVMRPNTAERLKERKGNSMKDYIHVAAPLGVTHIMAVSKTEKGPTLRIGRLPSGPTLTFKVMRYALSSHIRQSQRRPQDPTAAFQTSPLVVLNNFDQGADSGKRHLQLTALTFQAMFPTINVKTIDLADCRRVVLVSYNDDDGMIEFRHFMIRANPQGLSRQVKKILKSKIPNLKHTQDISELVIDNRGYGGSGYATSDSEGEDDAACVTLPKDYRGKGNVGASQSVIKLSEIGPRMSLQLLKIEDGAFGGEVQYHAYIERTEEEIQAMQKIHKERKELKEARKKEQEENVKRKQEAKEAKEQAKLERRKLREKQRLEEYESEKKAQGNNNEDEDLEADVESGDESEGENEIDEESEDEKPIVTKRRKSKSTQKAKRRKKA